MAQQQKDKQNPKKAKVTRRFLVVEGVYLNSADLCPLPDLLALKWKYKVRIFIDESLSFGVLGATGKGVTEHFGCDMGEVDMVCASLECAAGGGGGFACGRSFVVDHQRLCSLGYCFSASLPPFQARAALQALAVMRQQPQRFARLRRNSELLLGLLEGGLATTDFRVAAAASSPILHVKWGTELAEDADEETRQSVHANADAMLDKVVQKALEVGLVLTRARYLLHEEVFIPEPSIRLTVNSELTEDEVEDVASKIKQIVQEIS